MASAYIIPVTDVSIIFLADFKIALRVEAYRTYLGCFRTYYYVTAVAALPHCHAALFEHFHCFNIVEQGTVALLMMLFDSSNSAELCSDLCEAFFLGFHCHSLIHIRPLEVLALGCVEEILGSCSDTAQSLEP